MDKASNPPGTVEHDLVVKVTFGPCFEGVQGVYYTERGFVEHFGLEQRGCTNTQMLTMTIHEEEFVWTKCFRFCVATHVVYKLSEDPAILSVTTENSSSISYNCWNS